MPTPTSRATSSSEAVAPRAWKIRSGCAGTPPLSRLVARPIGQFRWFVCASPDYLRRHGAPADLDALARHVAVGHVHGGSGRASRWIFRQGPDTITPALATHVSVDDTDAYVAAGLAGLGLIRVASYMVAGHIAEGGLVRLLADIEAPPEPVSLLYPQSRHLAPAVRAFVDWSVEVMGRAAADW